MNLLSIAIPTYNRPEKLKRMLGFLYSELSSLSPSSRLLISITVVDNGSPNEVYTVYKDSYLAHEYNSQVNFIKHPKNLGLNGNLDYIYKNIEGEYLWLIGDDDMLRQGILKAVLSECLKKEYNYIFINHSVVKNNKVLYESMLGDINSKRTEHDSLLDLYFQSGTVMMFMSACVYRNKLVKYYIKRHKTNLVTPLSLSFYCASKGKTKYIEYPYIINDWTEISWKGEAFEVFQILIPRLLLKMPWWGYSFKRCWGRAYLISKSNFKGIIKYYLQKLLKQ